MILISYPTAIYIFLPILLLAACFIDAFQHRIPNWLNLAGLCSGLIIHTATSGINGILFSLLGIITGFLCFIPSYLYKKKLGAGDVKLMAAVGSFLGWKSTFFAAIYTIIAGAIIALIYITCKGGLFTSLKRYAMSFYLQSYIPPEKGEAAASRFPYALAITTGVIVQLWY